MIKKIKNTLRHYFFPHESNNYKARSLHSSSLLFYIILLFFVQTAGGFVNRTQPQILGYAKDITVERILDMVNQKRKSADLQPLSLSPELTTAATEKAADMFGKNYWAHISPTGVTPWVFIKSAGYDYLYAGENLAKSFDTADEVIKAWMNSPTHRANLLKPEYTEIGLAVMNGRLSGEETTLVVQEFGTKMVQPSKEIVNNKENNTQYQGAGDVASNTNETFSGIIETTNRPLLPFRLSKSFSLIVAEFLLVILFIDSIFILKNKTVRISGHSLAHIIFLAALIGAMGITGAGVIL